MGPTDMLELYGCRGCGSAAIEALLEWAGVAYTFHDVEPKTAGPEADAFFALNPLRQVPTVRFGDGTVLSESAAIILVLAEQHPAARLLPLVGDAARITALRWIVFIAANLYPAISVGDFPERWVEREDARQALKEGSRKRLEYYWQVLERALKPAPYLAGHEMTALDVYATMVAQWGPGRAWIDAQCPHIASALALVERQPFVARVWERNFKV